MVVDAPYLTLMRRDALQDADTLCRVTNDCPGSLQARTRRVACQMLRRLIIQYSPRIANTCSRQGELCCVQ
jgi:hypothetical protein